MFLQPTPHLREWAYFVIINKLISALKLIG